MRTEAQTKPQAMWWMIVQVIAGMVAGGFLIWSINAKGSPLKLGAPERALLFAALVASSHFYFRHPEQKVLQWPKWAVGVCFGAIILSTALPRFGNDIQWIVEYVIVANGLFLTLSYLWLRYRMGRQLDPRRKHFGLHVPLLVLVTIIVSVLPWLTSHYLAGGTFRIMSISEGWQVMIAIRVLRSETGLLEPENAVPAS